jgi:2-polyprenyl-3-methyl-5-hydroxy-6-metoxy-1,4-benzoquinol methylase
VTKLITETYRQQNAQLHKTHKYGQRGHRHLEAVTKLRKDYDCSSVLDYGCGQANLSDKAPFTVQNYDPAIDEYSKLPEPADLVVCTDVMEHAEVELLENVLSHLRSLTINVAYFVIATRLDTSKTLPDGSNPHKIVNDAKWWVNKLSHYFYIEDIEIKKGEVVILCTL